MSYTNQTPNYGLPQYVADDKPTYLGDFNKAMLDIDSAIKSTETMASSAESTANTANSNSTEALELANEAGDNALEAKTDAGQAKTLVENLTTRVSNAETDASTAKSLASNANNNANSAIEKSNVAESTAGVAKTTADNALSLINGTILFDNPNGETTSITLNEDITNFKYIEIEYFVKLNDTVKLQMSTGKIKAENNEDFVISTWYPRNTELDCKFHSQIYAITNNNTISFISSQNYTLNNTVWTNNGVDLKNLFITSIIGY